MLASTLTLSLLGNFRADLNGRPLGRFRTNKVQALLIYLVSEPERAHRREFLMELLWPGLPLEAAQVNLRQTLYLLRQAIPEVAASAESGGVSLVIADRLTVQFNPAAVCDVDVARFLRRLHGRPAIADREQAIALYQGDFLADFYLSDSNEFEGWAEGKRTNLRRQAIETLDVLINHYSAQRDSERVITYTRRQLELDNLRETTWRQHMRALTHSGRRHEALIAYETCRRVLWEELNLTPQPDTIALAEQIQTGEETPLSVPAYLMPIQPPSCGNRRGSRLARPN